MLYRKEANSRDRKSNIEKGRGGSIVEMRREICLKYSNMTKCLNTFVAHCRQRLNAQCEEIDISIDDRTIKRVDHTKSLGLTLDAQLSWSKHVDEKCKKASSAIGELKRVRPFIPTDVAVQIYNILILPHFDYCSPVWDCMSGYLSDKLQKLQNRAARVITQSPFETSSNA